MLLLMVVTAAICSVQSSGIGVPTTGSALPIANQPVVTAASSQYFERTFNRLVAAPQAPHQVLPVTPQVSPVFVQPLHNAIIPIAPAPPHVIQASPHIISVHPQVIPAPPQLSPTTPPVIPDTAQADPNQPNIAIAVATAHAAPVATILLPPYPFRPPPPAFGFVAPGPPVNVSQIPQEPTTPPTTTTETQVPTTEREPEGTTPESSNVDDNFVQALPSNENVNFNQVYGPPFPEQFWNKHRGQIHPQLPHQPFPQNIGHPVTKLQGNPQLQGNSLTMNAHKQAWPQKPQQNPHNYWTQKGRPLKLKTSVEVVKVPLAYIAPPPLHTHEKVKVIKHVYGLAPLSKNKIILRTIRTPGHVVTYRIPVSASVNSHSIRPELTTLRALRPTKNY